MDNSRLYKDLAWTWPIISPPEEYADETAEIIKLLREYTKIPLRRLLNLGCGGGHNDFNLKSSFDSTGVDISENMLALARKLNPEVNYRLGDMRSVRLDESFDAVTIFDSINYMCTVDDLKAAFKTAYDHLCPGGVLVTCIDEYVEKFKQNKTIHLTRSRGDVEITLIENYYDPDSSDTWYEDHMIYLIRRSGILTIENDYHRLGLFPIRTFETIMKEAGFDAQQLSSSILNGAGEECPIIVGVKPQVYDLL